MRFKNAAFVLCVLITVPLACAEDWPGWRGPRGDGSCQESKVPTRWNGQSGENILWKTKLPGWGHSSPIVFQGTLFVTACKEDDQTRMLIRVDAKSGEIIWKRPVLKSPLEKRHSLNSFASGTPATDGSRVYMSFLEADFASDKDRTPGNLVVAAFDLDGKQVWMVKPGRFASVHGFCSSPVLFQDLVIVNGDHDGDGYLVALSRDTGQVRWKVARPNHTRSYVTPLIREIDGRTQMILSGSKCVASYDPHDGKQHWYMEGPTEQFVASLVYNGQFVFLTAGFPDHHILAIKPQGSGTLTDDAIVWRTTKNCSYVPSPVICGDYFLVVSDNGVASCYEANSGTSQWTKRLDTKNHSSSLMTANGLVYFVADDGVTRIVRPGPTYELIAENPLGEDCYSSPAVSDSRLYLRGRNSLFCIGEAESAAGSAGR